MTPLDKSPELQAFYRDRKVVDAYMERRTAQPLNGVLHRRQVSFLNQAFQDRKPSRVLEVACGPGRLTTAVHGIGTGVAVDASPGMLETARRRWQGSRTPWSFLRTDAFVLPFRDESFDAAYTLRFIRHFQLDDRRRLYAEISRVLRPNGWFLLDALNRQVSLPSRLKRGIDSYKIYDVLYEPGEIEKELEASGFRVLRCEGQLFHHELQRRLNRLRRVRLNALATGLIEVLERVPGGNPLGWMLLCEKVGKPALGHDPRKES